MNLIADLQEPIRKWALSESKFYRAWSSGDLPVSALKTYAEEYGAFINLLPAGWEIQDDEETAEEEREHAELWEEFADALQTKIGEAKLPQIRNLMSVATELFSDRASAMGALFAFEAQQPETSKSKLEGLRKFYAALGTAGEPYFEIHSNNDHEAAKLLERMSGLTAEEKKRATDACGVMARALREALDGIYDAECGGCCSHSA